MQKRSLLYLSIVAAIIFSCSYAQAALQFLPRYQGSYGVRSQSGGRKDVSLSCASYGGVEKGTNQTCTGQFSAGGKTCYKSCSCDNLKFQYTIASHQGTGKLCASLSNACTDSGGTYYSGCVLNNCNVRNSTWISESSKSSYTSNNYTCTSQNTSGKDGTCYVCTCPSSWATGSCPANAASCSTCKAISPYTVSKFNLVSCKTGYYKNGNSCTQCPAGSYCDGTNKTTCPAGSYSAAGASSCTQCQAGKYSAAGATSCTDCAAGTYSTAGSSSCLKCSAGTYSAAGASSCTTCSEGKYSTAGSSSCISCSPKQANSTHTGCVDCSTDSDCTKVSGGKCSGGTCVYPVITCNSTTDRSSEKAACGAVLMGYKCSSCTAQTADGTQSSQYNCTCEAKTLYPNGSSGTGSNGYLMEGANYGIDTLCDNWHIVCPNSKCKAGYYYSGGGCLACTGNTYSFSKATSCKACPEGQYVNDAHTKCIDPACEVESVTIPTGASCSEYNSCNKCLAWACKDGYVQSGDVCDKISAGFFLYADGTIGNSTTNGKTIIGVVFDVSKRLAIALKDLGKFVWSTESIYWETTTDSEGVHVKGEYVDTGADSSSDGRSNTDTVLNFCEGRCESAYPAFYKVEKYSTSGIGKAGEWFIPASGQLGSINDNMDVLNESLAKANNGTSGNLLEDEYWASTDTNGMSSYRKFSSGSGYMTTGKTKERYFRAIINY